MNYKIIVQYDGTRYEGWQKQGNTDNTIQGKLEEVLGKMYGQEVEVHGAGRTDAGVHALGQTANFHLPDDWVKDEWKGNTKEILAYLNRYLPEDIGVIAIEVVPERFHSRLNAKQKVYRYRISTNEIPNVFERKYIYPLNKKLDVGLMKEAGGRLSGTWDYKSFCSNKKTKKSMVRTLDKIKFEQKDGELWITFIGNGFLYNMVRILTGTLIEVGQGKRDPESMRAILDGKDRQLAGVTAPARGLSLIEVSY